MEKKYEMFKENEIDKLYRIRALRDFGDVKKGDLGGFIEKEENLSHIGNCWVYDNARVCGNACVFDNAWVFGNARVFGNAQVSGEALVYSNARVYGNAQVFGNAQVSGNARVYGDAWVYGDAQVYGDAVVCEYHTIITGHCTSNLLINIKESIRCQTGLCVMNNKIIAYKSVNKDLTSIYDPSFQYKVGEIAEVTDYDESNASCSVGLHFSSANYPYCPDDNFAILMAEINLDDIITVQQGKIRCKRAKILDVYIVSDNT